LVLNGGAICYTNSINQTNFISGAETTVGTNGAIFEITDSNVTNTIQAVLNNVGGQEGKLIKRGAGALRIGRANLAYVGATAVENGLLIVSDTNFTAQISSNVVTMAFSNNVSNGTYRILPGQLTGAYALNSTGLTNQKATLSTASPASVTVTDKLSQTITGLASSNTVVFGVSSYPLGVQSTSTSGIPLNFLSSDTNVATVSSEGWVTIVGAGSTTIRVNQAGDSDYSAATEVTQVLTVVNASSPSGPTFASAYTNLPTDVAPNGLTYLANYAFGGSSSKEAALPYQEKSDASRLALIAYVRTNDNTISVKGEKGNSLDNWDTNLINGNPADDNDGAPPGTQKQIFSVTKSGDRLFLRLKVTKQ
jgi:hypothetical protein